MSIFGSSCKTILIVRSELINNEILVRRGKVLIVGQEGKKLILGEVEEVMRYLLLYKMKLKECTYFHCDTCTLFTRVCHQNKS